MKNKKKQEMKQNEINWKRVIVRKRIEENKELKRYERIQNRENKNEEDVDLILFFEKTTAENDIIVDGLNQHEIKNDILGHYEGEFEMTGD